VPQRNPLYTAKEVASLDWLSGGRFDFGIGIGWLKEEFEALDVPWGRRGARTVDYLRLMQKLWAPDTASHASDFYTMPECRQDPKPVQQPHPPFVFGGESDAALRRVAEIGQGWFGFDLDPDGARERLGKLEGLLAERGRSLAEIRVSVCPMRRRVTPELAREYESAGVEQIILLAGGRTSDIVVERMAAMADELGMAMAPA
jgi:alkanesulfonate monooxygenase SsuD/methylene tetrahydromethanopterin reductase-like flavin-dependent oxidoreductase (luciferase family)